MIRRPLIRVWLLCLLFCGGLAAAQGLEVIRLHHLPAEQIIPQLQPMLAPGGALTGRGDSLFVSTTPANLAALRQMVAVLDKAPRRLVISVRHSGRQADARAGAAVGGSAVIGPGGGVRLQGAIGESVGSRGDEVAQRVQTVEGGRAYIQVGQSLPVTQRQLVQTPRGPVVSETTGYREVGSGFYVEPRLTGERVTLSISTARDTPGRIPGSAEVRQVSSVVSGRLGEWIALGGTSQQVSRESRGLGGQALRESSDEQQVWLMVEALD